jgi:5-formyltetrahydrofolate cyclo-ligase
MSISEQKKKIRQQMLVQRARLPNDWKATYDQWICHALMEHISAHDFQHIHLFLPMGTEINIWPLIEELLASKRMLIAPKTLPKRQLENRILTALDQLEPGVFGTRHPIADTPYTGPIDLIIAPGLAFDAANNRLGYGGGYYDAFLKSHPNAHTLGIFYPFQKLDSVPLEAHDMPLDSVLVDLTAPPPHQ